MAYPLQTCSRCVGQGYIPEYKHNQNGICFACWGSGNSKFKNKYPLLANELQTQLVLNNSEINLEALIPLINDVLSIDEFLQKCLSDEDHDGVSYYDSKMNERISDIYRLMKK